MTMFYLVGLLMNIDGDILATNKNEQELTREIVLQRIALTT